MALVLRLMARLVKVMPTINSAAATLQLIRDCGSDAVDREEVVIDPQPPSFESSALHSS